MTQLRLRSSSIHEHGSRTCGFHDCGSNSRALFFHGSSFCSFSQINIFNCLGVPQIEWKMNYNQVHKTKRTHQTFLSDLIWQFLPAALLPWGNQRKNKTNRFKQSRLPLLFCQTCTHALTQMWRCVWKPFVQINSMTSSKKFTFDFFKIAENFWFLIFCTHDMQWWITK